MLHWLLSPLQDQIPTLRLFNYLAFRGAGAAVTALLRLTDADLGEDEISRLRDRIRKARVSGR